MVYLMVCLLVYLMVCPSSLSVGLNWRIYMHTMLIDFEGRCVAECRDDLFD